MGIKNPTLSNNNDLVRVKADYRKINNEQVLAIKKKKKKILQEHLKLALGPT